MRLPQDDDQTALARLTSRYTAAEIARAAKEIEDNRRSDDNGQLAYLFGFLEYWRMPRGERLRSLNISEASASFAKLLQTHAPGCAKSPDRIRKLYAAAKVWYRDFPDFKTRADAVRDDFEAKAASALAEGQIRFPLLLDPDPRRPRLPTILTVKLE